jgi:cyclopropane fatty-acyl-phospholipid synthase-like methyltransferase
MALLESTRKSYGVRYRGTPSGLLSDERKIFLNYDDIFEKIDILGLLDLKSGETFYELGSGDGRVLIRAVQKYGVSGIGIENDSELVVGSKRNIGNFSLDDRITIIQGSYYDMPLHDADAIYMFLNNTEARLLKEKFERELKPGARVLSLAFPIPEWKTADHLRVLIEIPEFDHPVRSTYLYVR